MAVSTVAEGCHVFVGLHTDVMPFQVNQVTYVKGCKYEPECISVCPMYEEEKI